MEIICKWFFCKVVVSKADVELFVLQKQNKHIKYMNTHALTPHTHTHVIRQAEHSRFRLRLDFLGTLGVLCFPKYLQRSHQLGAGWLQGVFVEPL